MLHVFYVNRGSMWTYDVKLAMERVSELKNAISKTKRILVEDQVILINTGEVLRDTERVCSYAAGTETNPVFFFNRANIENDITPARQFLRCGNDLTESVQHALSLPPPPSYQTITLRTKLAMQLKDATIQDVKLAKETIHEKRLMSQGWIAAFHNLTSTRSKFQDRYPKLLSQCQAKLQHIESNSDIYDGMDDTLTMLSTIPLLPTLLKDGDTFSDSSEHEQSQLSLLHWIEANCKNVSIKKLLQECKQKQKYLSQERLRSLAEACKTAAPLVDSSSHAEITGLKDRFIVLESLIESAEKLVGDQKGLAMGFVNNRKAAREHSSSTYTLQMLCESHVNQLETMVKNESKAKYFVQQCIDGKNELAEKLHRRLRVLYVMQERMNEADTSLSMFLQQLMSLERHSEFLSQVKLAPSLYLSSLTEVVRRKHFRYTYFQWVSKAIVDAKVERDKEILKRETFQSNIEGHFIQKLFHGFLDKPPSLAKKPLRSFDEDLPEVTEEQLYSMSKLLPNYKDILQVSFTDSGLTLSSVRSNLNSSVTTSAEEKVEEQTESTSPPESRSLSTSMPHSNTGSFAVVDSATISHSQSSNPATVSAGKVKEEKEDQNGGNICTELSDTTELPQRAQSSVTLTNESISHSPSNSESDNENEFARLGDVDVGSPPDSEFFSILPQQFGDGSSPQFSNQQNNHVTSASPVVIPESFESPKSFHRLNSVGNVGSIDSNSFHKVDELSSDDEMFHSITDEQQDLKTLRKKLQKLQSDYEKLSESSIQEKEELQLFIKKLQTELKTLQEHQLTSEAEFNKRCNDSKTELNNLIGQLESERTERQKASEDLQKKLKTATEQYALQEGITEKMKQELAAKTDQLQKLQFDIAENRRHHEVELVDKAKEMEEIKITKADEIANLKCAMEKLEKKLSLGQTHLTEADDRIQELEDLLSECDRKEQENAEHIMTYEGKLNELSNQLKFAFESQQKSSSEKDEATNKILKSEAALVKANEQISSLTKLIADSEDKMAEYRNTIESLKHFEANFHTLQSEKSQLETEVRYLSSTIDTKEIELQNIEKELHQTQSIVKEKTESYAVELEKLRSSHLTDRQSLCEQHEDYVASLNRNFENEHDQLLKSCKHAVYEKEQEMKKLIEETSISHRNEMDEHEADRMAEYALAQQEIEAMKEKLNESYQQLEQQKKDAADSNDELLKKLSKVEEECTKLTQEKEQLRVDGQTLNEKLSVVEREAQDLRQQSNQESVNAPTDGEKEIKRSSADTGSLVDGRGSSVDLVALEADNSDLVSAHQREIDALKESFRKDKFALESIYKRKEEAGARRSQVIFNSAIQRVRDAKDVEIKKLQEQLMAQSQTALSQSTVDPSEITMSMLEPIASSPTSHPPMTMSMTQPTVSRLYPHPQMTMSMTEPNVSSLAPQMTRSMTQPTVSQFTPALEEQACASQSEQASVSQLSQTTDITRDMNRVTVASFKRGDTVLVCFNDTYKRFTLFTISRTLHFIHQGSIDELGLISNDHDAKKTMTFAVFLDKEYCQARKAQNRFGIPVNTKFYRVRVLPFLKKN